MSEIPAIFRTLRKYRSEASISEHRGGTENIFWPVDTEDIRLAEKKMGLRLPPQLCQLYLEVGYGMLCKSRSGAKCTEDLNYFRAPLELASAFLREIDAIKIWPELWDADELPFFNYAGHSCLVLRIGSPDPDAVYRTGERDPVSPDLVSFVERLYEDPVFYLDEDLDDDEA